MIHSRKIIIGLAAIVVPVVGYQLFSGLGGWIYILVTPLFLTLVYFFFSTNKRRKLTYKSFGLSREEYSLFEEKLRKDEKKLGKKLDKDDLGLFIEFMEQQKKAFSIDWKWAPDDIIYALERLVPTLKYTTKLGKFDEEKKEWRFDGLINGERIDMLIPFDNPELFIEKLNPILTRLTGKMLVGYHTGDDSYGWFLVPKESV